MGNNVFTYDEFNTDVIEKIVASCLKSDNCIVFDKRKRIRNAVNAKAVYALSDFSINPFDLCKEADDFADIATILWRTYTDVSDNRFNKQALLLIKAVCLYMYESLPMGKRSVGALKKLVSSGLMPDPTKAHSSFLSALFAGIKNGDSKALKMYNDYMASLDGESEKEIINEAMNMFSIYSDDDIAYMNTTRNLNLLDKNLILSFSDPIESLMASLIIYRIEKEKLINKNIVFVDANEMRIVQNLPVSMDNENKYIIHFNNVEKLMASLHGTEWLKKIIKKSKAYILVPRNYEEKKKVFMRSVGKEGKFADML